MQDHVDRGQLGEMEERLIEQVEQMAGRNIDDIDDEEYERLQAVLIESMTAQEVIDIDVNDDDD